MAIQKKDGKRVCDGCGELKGSGFLVTNWINKQVTIKTYKFCSMACKEVFELAYANKGAV